eukprot:4625738-Alexandrium_andersonii.AAC.1
MKAGAAPIRNRTTSAQSAFQLTVGLAGKSCSADTLSTLVAWPGTVMLAEMQGSALVAVAPWSMLIGSASSNGRASKRRPRQPCWSSGAVSYTHLTLPTICSV